MEELTGKFEQLKKEDTVEQRCKGCSYHVQFVQNRAKAASVYPRKLVDAILDGLEEHLEMEGGGQDCRHLESSGGGKGQIFGMV